MKCISNDIDLRPKTTATQTTERTVVNYIKGGDDEMAAILTAGLYVLCKNIPDGIYGLVPIKGGGWLTIFDKNADEVLIWLGERDD